MHVGPPKIFDRRAVVLHRERAKAIAGDDFLVRGSAEGLAGRLAAVRRTFSSGLELCGRNSTSPIFRPFASNWVLADLGDNESFSAGMEQFDLIVSVLSLHSVNDLPGVLVQARRALKPDGLLLAALFGGETLFELKESLAAAEIEVSGGVSPRVAPFADVREVGGLLQRAGFALPVADVERTVVRYRDFMTLVADLRAMGETNSLAERSRRSLSKMVLAAAMTHYASKHADEDGRLRATFDIVYLTGWAPHASQQQPLKPGSATSSLAEALGTTEHSTGAPKG